MENPCAHCGSVFTRPKNSKRRTCSKACRYRLVSETHKAIGTVPPGWTPAQREEARARLTGPNAPWWKGGRFLRKGYVFVKPTADWMWPEMITKQGYIREHRLVMAQHIGRALKSSEVCHHINGDKEDNRIENLELFASHSEHKRHEHAARRA